MARNPKKTDTASPPPEIILGITQDAVHQLDMSFLEGLAEPSIVKGIVEAIGSSLSTPQIKINVEKSQLIVNVVGDSRSRQVVAMSMGLESWLVGEEEGPVEMVTRPYGDDAVAVFAFSRALPTVPSVHIEWETALNKPIPIGDDPESEDEVIKVRTLYTEQDTDFDEDTYYENLLKEVDCLSEED